MTGHLDLDQLMGAAEAGDGSGAVGLEVRGHVSGCPSCRGRYEKVRSALLALPEVLADKRPGCPPAEDLASIPPGGAWEHPHVRSCPLCLAEVHALHDLESRRILGGAWAGGAPPRPQYLTTGGQAHLFAGVGALKIDLKPGATGSGSVGGATVSLRVEGSRLLVRVEGSPSRPLVLVLENDLLTRSEKLEELEVLGAASGEYEFPVGTWLRASVVPGEPVR